MFIFDTYIKYVVVAMWVYTSILVSSLPAFHVYVCQNRPIFVPVALWFTLKSDIVILPPWLLSV